MRPLVLHIATSLDGYIAGLKDELDWLFPSGLVQVHYGKKGKPL